MSFSTITKPAFYVIGIVCRTTNKPDEGPIDIPKLWERFKNEEVYFRIPNKASDDVIGLYCDYESDHTGAYSLVIGCPVTSLENIPEGFVGKEVPESTYAVFPISGEFPQSLINAWGEVWNTPLNRTFSGDFELYGHKFMTSPSKDLELFIAIDKN